MEKCVPANFTRSRQGRLLAVVPVQRGGGGRERNERERQGEEHGAAREKRGKRDRRKGERDERKKKPTKRRNERRQEEDFCNRVKDAHTRGTVARAALHGGGPADTWGWWI